MARFSNTNPRPGDSLSVLLAKACQKLGGTPAQGDSPANLLRKIVVAVGGTFQPGDSRYREIAKILAALGGIAALGDPLNTVLWKIAEALGASPATGDSNYILLSKILLTSQAQATPADNFITRAGLTDAGQISAVRALYASAVANGWWDKCDLIYPFVGGSAASHAQNLKSSSFSITWNGTVSHDANGITGSGSPGSGYGDTGYHPTGSGQMSLNSTHVSAYRRSLGNDQYYFGAGESGAVLAMSRFLFIPTAVLFAVNDGTTVDAATLTSLRLISVNRLGFDFKQVVNAATTKSVGRLSTSQPPSARKLYILAWDNNGNPTNFQTANLACLTAGSGLTFAEFSAMETDWQTFQTSLGRQV